MIYVIMNKEGFYYFHENDVFTSSLDAAQRHFADVSDDYPFITEFEIDLVDVVQFSSVLATNYSEEVMLAAYQELLKKATRIIFKFDENSIEFLKPKEDSL